MRLSVERLHHSHSISFMLFSDDVVWLTKPDVEITSKVSSAPKLVPIT
jgi:hypothetical protein